MHRRIAAQARPWANIRRFCFPSTARPGLRVRACERAASSRLTQDIYGFGDMFAEDRPDVSKKNAKVHAFLHSSLCCPVRVVPTVPQFRLQAVSDELLLN